jgi:hypothetical protein
MENSRPVVAGLFLYAKEEEMYSYKFLFLRQYSSIRPIPS